MNNQNDNKKAKLWVYGVILFTSAFVILLLTAYSQIKLNRNLSDYRNQVSSKETEKKKVQQNFSSAQEMNAKLNGEIKKLQEENSSLKGDVSDLKAHSEMMDKKYESISVAEDGLAEALNTYMNGNIVECAGLIDKIDYASLDGKSVDTYKTLSLKAKAEAAKIIYEDGYSLYRQGKYAEAEVKFALSYQYASKEYFSDNCLFYLAYSEFRQDNMEDALVHMNQLIYNYPNSGYLKSAKRFVNKYQQ